MKILLVGASGFIGSALKKALTDAGHKVISLTRKKGLFPNELYWDPEVGILDPESVEGFDGWINLAGENISGRWSDEKKRKILESRKKSASLLAKTAASLKKPPKVILSASAVGFYGTNRQGEKLTEKESSGKGFLATVAKEWEEALEPAEKKGVRVVKLRFGVVLSKEGGPLKKMMIPFKIGLGGAIGDGSQVMSWVSLDDVIRIIQFCLVNEIEGPINCTAPHPVSNKEFTKSLAKALNRPAFVPMPAFLARLVLGEMADELLLSSVYALPEQLTRRNFQFKHPTIEKFF